LADERDEETCSALYSRSLAEKGADPPLVLEARPVFPLLQTFYRGLSLLRSILNSLFKAIVSAPLARTKATYKPTADFTGS